LLVLESSTAAARSTRAGAGSISGRVAKRTAKGGSGLPGVGMFVSGWFDPSG
jgi:hypothetical protein